MKESLYLGYREDETAARCRWVVAASHPFEAWGDGRAFDGTASIVQPLLSPLFESLSEAELLAALGGQEAHLDTGGRELLRAGWRARSEEAAQDQVWEGWVAKGVVPGTAFAPESVEPDLAAVARAVQAAASAAGKAEGLEAAFVPDYKLLDGRFAENAWLQELPDPITKVTWDNAAYLSPATAARLGVEGGVRSSCGWAAGRWRRRCGSCPATPTTWSPCRSATGAPRPGRWAARGLRRRSAAHGGGPRVRGRPGAGAAPGAKHPFALTQEHFSMEGRELALSFDAKDWKPAKVEHLKGPLPTLQPAVDYSAQQYRWGMAIDLARAPAAAPASSPARPRTTSRWWARSRCCAAARCTGSASTATSAARPRAPTWWPSR